MEAALEGLVDLDSLCKDSLDRRAGGEIDYLCGCYCVKWMKIPVLQTKHRDLPTKRSLGKEQQKAV